MDVRNKPTYRFDEIEVDASRSSVTRNGKDYYLRQQTFQVLLYLLKNHERVVGKEELVEEIWDHTAVTDNALVQCITTIRKVLGDDSRHPRFIRTIPKVGYRFIRPIEVMQGTGSPEAGGAERTGAHQALRKGVVALRQRAAIVGVAALLLV